MRSSTERKTTRFRFSIRGLLVATLLFAVGIFAIQNPSKQVVQAMQFGIFASLCGSLFFVVRSEGIQRAFFLGFMVASIASLGLSIGLPLPPQQYL